jgi:ribonuclease-3
MKFLKDYGINIKKIELVEEALTHSSYTNEHKGLENYERLEFLGDAVLELITSEYFYLNTSYREGEMSKLRSRFVCEQALAYICKNIGIDYYIKLGHGQLHNLNDTIRADVYEAVLGAIYLDQGYNVAKKFVYDTLIPYIKENKLFFKDYKTILQELVQTDRKSLEYVLTSESGEPHERIFNIDVKIDNIVYGHGSGKSKKEAEQNAAYDAYLKSVK